MTVRAYSIFFAADEQDVQGILDTLKKKGKVFQLNEYDHLPRNKKSRTEQDKQVEKILLSYQDKKTYLKRVITKIEHLNEQVEVVCPGSNLDIVVSRIGFANSMTEQTAIKLVADQQALELEKIRIEQEIAKIDLALLELNPDEFQFVEIKYLKEKASRPDEYVMRKMHITNRNKLYELKMSALQKLRKYLIEEGQQENQLGLQ